VVEEVGLTLGLRELSGLRKLSLSWKECGGFGCVGSPVLGVGIEGGKQRERVTREGLGL